MYVCMYIDDTYVCKQLSCPIHICANPLMVMHTHRVNQAFALSSMSLEEMLSRQSNLVALHEEIQAQETQGLKDEIIQLSK